MGVWTWAYKNPDHFEVPPPDCELLTYQELLAMVEEDKRGKE